MKYNLQNKTGKTDVSSRLFCFIGDGNGDKTNWNRIPGLEKHWKQKDTRSVCSGVSVWKVFVLLRDVHVLYII